MMSDTVGKLPTDDDFTFYYHENSATFSQLFLGSFLAYLDVPLDRGHRVGNKKNMRSSLAFEI